MKNNLQKYSIVSIILIVSLIVSSCSYFKNDMKNMQEEFQGLEATIQTFDAQGQVIDNVKGNSISVETDNRFDIKGSDGSVTKESSVLNIKVGGKQMYHVGSSLVMQEQGTTNILNNTNARAEVNDTDSSVPFLSRLKNEFKNDFTGQNMTVLIRSQQGIPIAVFTGDNVSTFQAENIPNSTALLIDDKRVFLYRVDFSIYDTSLLGDNGQNDNGEVKDSPVATTE